MVEKLKLKTESHPQPCKLTWFRKGNEVKVNKRCLVQFSIGKNYHYEVLCDVVPMDACHLLLGNLSSMIEELAMIVLKTPMFL